MHNLGLVPKHSAQTVHSLCVCMHAFLAALMISVQGPDPGGGGGGGDSNPPFGLLHQREVLLSRGECAPCVESTVMK